MKRRAVGRDPALVVRMLLALGLLAAFYAAIAVSEYGADRGSAVLTGEPEQLMSALQKLSDRHIPDGDLRLQGAEAFCIVPAQTRRFEVFMDHPPLSKRLAALEHVARDLGKPAKSH